MAEFAIVPDDRSQPDWDALDERIRPIVRTLWEHGVETYESCQGGDGHAFTEPTVRFHGDSGDGFRALCIAIQYNLGAFSLRRHWQIYDQMPHGPQWEMTFILRDGK